MLSDAITRGDTVAGCGAVTKAVCFRAMSARVSRTGLQTATMCAQIDNAITHSCLTHPPKQHADIVANPIIFINTITYNI